MDMWLVAAVIGAGCLAKYWNNNSKQKDSQCKLCSGNPGMGNVGSTSCTPCKIGGRMKSDKAVSADKSDSKQNFSDINFKSVRSLEDCNVLTISNLSTELASGTNLSEHGDANTQMSDSDKASNYCTSCRPTSADQLSCVYPCTGDKISLRTTFSRASVMRPLNSLESCFMAQLYNEYAQMEEYIFNCFTSPSTPTTRPLSSSDRSHVISRANGNYFTPLVRIEETNLQKERCRRIDHVSGIPPLPEIQSSKILETGKGLSERFASCKTISEKESSSQKGSPDGALLFFLGTSIGVISSLLVNKREVDQLNELLKQTENLVHDLYEELEMKDSVTVKELAKENYDFQDTSNTSNCSERNCDEGYDQKADENSVSLSRIEAELEAELETLGLNMDAPAMERRFSDPIELDPYFFTDFAHGELRGCIHERKYVEPPNLYEDKDLIHSVPPRELSLRLHELIQSRLEQRVKELEVALESCERKVQVLESGQKNHYSNDISDCILGYPPSREIQVAGSEVQPFVMNLSGEALNAYNEACEEIIKMDISENDSPSGYHHNERKGLDSRDSLVEGYHIGAVDQRRLCTANPQDFSSEAKSSRDIIMSKAETPHVSDMYFLDDDNDCDDEIDTQLIREFVKRTKGCSPVVPYAERILYSMDETAS